MKRKFKVTDLFSNPFLPGMEGFMVSGVSTSVDLAQIPTPAFDPVGEIDLVEDLVMPERPFSKLWYPDWLRRPTTIGQYKPVAVNIGDRRGCIFD